MRKYGDTVVAVLIATALALPAAVFSFSSGANSGLTSGPGSNADNCTVCHEFGTGIGAVEILHAPQRYLPGRTYDLTVLVSDPVQLAAGFEISAESPAGHTGTLILSDPVNTQFADGFPSYITHTSAGYASSLSGWATNGFSHGYALQWLAPDVDSGTVTFYAVGNAANHSHSPVGEHFYSNHAFTRFAQPGDADGDADVDLRDFATLQRCFDGAAGLPSACAFVDNDADEWVTLSDYGTMFDVLLGPTATDPPEFLLADRVRGAKLYDKWWKAVGLPEPTNDHPLWAVRPDAVSNMLTGSATWRCKECHGWDYKGVDGVYGSGGHRTGITGIFGTTKTAREIFDLLRDPGGHAYTSGVTGLTDEDIWDLVKFVLAGQVDTDTHIAADGSFFGDFGFGSFRFGQACINCHGSDGRNINFGTPANPEYVGTVASVNPWEFLHKARFGHPGSPMVGTELLQWNISRASDIGAFAQALPTQ